jgi:C-terminal processing protease CtpA/Prc
MKKLCIGFCLVICLVIGGCASTRLDFYMVNPFGDIQSYSTRKRTNTIVRDVRELVVGRAVSEVISVEEWKSEMKKLGYISTSKAGDVGVILHSSFPKIVTILPHSPAAAVGMQNDDIIIEVEKVNINTATEANVALFGEKDQPVQIRVLRNSKDTLQFDMVRESYAKIRGLLLLEQQ